MQTSFRVSHRRSEPDVGVGHARPGYPRETERPDWTGRCGRRRTGKGVPSSDHPSVAEGSSGARADGGAGRYQLLRQASLEAVLARAQITSGWALTLGRARILRTTVQRRGNWPKASRVAMGQSSPSVCFEKEAGGEVSRRRLGLDLTLGSRLNLHRPLTVDNSCRMATFEGLSRSRMFRREF